MNAKQIKQATKLINIAMLKLQDARDTICSTDAEAMAATNLEVFRLDQLHNDLTGAISNLHYAMSRLE